MLPYRPNKNSPQKLPNSALLIFPTDAFLIVLVEALPGLVLPIVVPLLVLGDGGGLLVAKVYQQPAAFFFLGLTLGGGFGRF